MGFVLRRVNKEVWDKDKVYADYSWLKPNQIPAECLNDLKATGNELSLWYVENEHDPNLVHICAALAATLNNFIEFEYALFDVEIIEAAQFTLHETDGNTPDTSIKHLHRDLKELTASELLRFLETVWEETITGLVLEDRIEKLIRDGVLSSRINQKMVNGNLRKKLGL